MKIVSKNLQETEEIARDFLEKLSLASYEQATIVGLYGDLGSGKTTFTQFVAKSLGIKENITSPTFVIQKKYDIKHNFFKKFIHIDAYRFESSKEILVLDWEGISKNPHNFIFIEWPERISEILPNNHMKIFFKFISENEREIEI
jgi:tRNA threonylcarbamoyladenosine biosynthesis protein TsaE